VVFGEGLLVHEPLQEGLQVLGAQLLCEESVNCVFEGLFEVCEDVELFVFVFDFCIEYGAVLAKEAFNESLLFCGCGKFF